MSSKLQRPTHSHSHAGIGKVEPSPRKLSMRTHRRRGQKAVPKVTSVEALVDASGTGELDESFEVLRVDPRLMDSSSFSVPPSPVPMGPPSQRLTQRSEEKSLASPCVLSARPSPVAMSLPWSPAHLARRHSTGQALAMLASSPRTRSQRPPSPALLRSSPFGEVSRLAASPRQGHQGQSPLCGTHTRLNSPRTLPAPKTASVSPVTSLLGQVNRAERFGVGVAAKDRGTAHPLVKPTRVLLYYPPFNVCLSVLSVGGVMCHMMSCENFGIINSLGCEYIYACVYGSGRAG